MMFYPEIKHFAARLERRATKAIARTVVAKELAKITYYVLTRQQEFKTFKGIEINKLRDPPERAAGWLASCSSRCTGCRTAA
jgi:hypothetical protein